jgi:hypothetical protein
MTPDKPGGRQPSLTFSRLWPLLLWFARRQLILVAVWLVIDRERR